MSFGQRKQTFEKDCIAGPTSSFYLTMGGLLAYQSLSVESTKLVLAVAYFGLDYKCLVYTENIRCYIENASYRGSRCSSNVAKVVPWNELVYKYDGDGRGTFWDEHSSTVMFNFVVSDSEFG